MKPYINKTIVFLRKEKVQYSLSICLFIILFGFGCFHATKGIDLTDEGMYLSTAMRYSLGDTPFRDEIMNIMRPFDVLVAPVFVAFPDISLFQMRSLGLLLHTVSIFVLFLFLSRYMPPFFVALACCGIFFSSLFIMSPSYNNLSRDFSIIAMVFWLASCLSVVRVRRVLFSILGGCFFTLVVLSYPPQFIVIFVPLSVVIICFLCPGQHQSFLQPSVIFIATFATSMLLVLIIVFSFGLLPDLVQGFLAVVSSTELASKGLWSKVHNVFEGLLHIAPIGLKLCAIYGVAFVFLIFQREKRGLNIAFSVIAIIIALSSLKLFFSQGLGASYSTIVLSFTFIFGIISFFLNDKRELASISPNTGWTMVKNYTLAWGFISSLIYGISSTGLGFRQCIYGIAPIYVIGMIALYRYIEGFVTPHVALSFRKTPWYAVILIMMFSFIVFGSYFHYHYTYREAAVENLTARFKHPKLAGIYSTPEKVAVIEELLKYLQDKMNPEDYFLCYNDIPMLYFLTHTRPAYGAAWARNDWPDTLLNRLVKKMIYEDKVPKYCVRTLMSPGASWGGSNSQTIHNNDPLNEFVMSNYYLEKIISPFEIWHHGKGQKFQLFDQMVPTFRSSFSKWKGPDTVRLHDLAKTAAPLTNLGYSGDFKFSRISSEDGYIIRVTPVAKSEKGEMVIQFGYSLNKDGFDLKLNPGQEVVFIVSARLSDISKKGTSLFIQDKAGRWERISTAVNKLSWDQYEISKRIRKGATRVDFGILWQPENENEWLEIKDVRFYVCDERM